MPPLKLLHLDVELVLHRPVESTSNRELSLCFVNRCIITISSRRLRCSSRMFFAYVSVRYFCCVFCVIGPQLRSRRRTRQAHYPIESISEIYSGFRVQTSRTLQKNCRRRRCKSCSRDRRGEKPNAIGNRWRASRNGSRRADLGGYGYGGA